MALTVSKKIYRSLDDMKAQISRLVEGENTVKVVCSSNHRDSDNSICTELVAEVYKGDEFVEELLYLYLEHTDVPEEDAEEHQISSFNRLSHDKEELIEELSEVYPSVTSKDDYIY